MTAAPPAYEIAHAEALLMDLPDSAAETTATLRSRFRAGYAPDGSVPAVPDTYRVDARLRLMKHLDMEVGERDTAAIHARVQDHVQSLETLGVLSRGHSDDSSPDDQH